jgi:hypothetical protein
MHRLSQVLIGTGLMAPIASKRYLIKLLTQPVPDYQPQSCQQYAASGQMARRGICPDGEMVIALWDGAATAKDGKPYRNTYTWYFRMQDGKAIEAIAFLDIQEFNSLWTRVSPKN